MNLKDQIKKASIVVYLHDVLEDCPNLNSSIIGNNFSDEIEYLVTLLSKNYCGKSNYEQYIEEISKDRIIRGVKICDINCNLADSPTDEQKEKYKIALEILGY